MKTIAIILGLIVAGLAFGLYQRNASATAEAAASVTAHHTLSNQVAELRTKLALEQGTSGQTVSNLDNLVKRRDASLAYTSNRLVQANLLLKSVENQARATLEELQSKTARLAVVEDERNQLARRVEDLSTLEPQIIALKAELAGATTAREAVEGEVRRLELEKTELARKLDDIGFLRLQLARAEEDADLKRRLARSGAKASVSSKARLELQADGTVRPLLPVTN